MSSPELQSQSSGTHTPLRNNYAAPHTPIASAKRPRQPGSSCRGSGTGSNNMYSVSGSGNGGGSVTKMHMSGSRLNSVCEDGTFASDENLDLSVALANGANVATPVRRIKLSPTGLASPSDCTNIHNIDKMANITNANHNATNNITTNKLVMSPMHPPKGLPHGGLHGRFVPLADGTNDESKHLHVASPVNMKNVTVSNANGNVNSHHHSITNSHSDVQTVDSPTNTNTNTDVDTDTDAQSNTQTTNWAGIFSPVLNFLHNNNISNTNNAANIQSRTHSQDSPKSNSDSQSPIHSCHLDFDTENIHNDTTTLNNNYNNNTSSSSSLQVLQHPPSPSTLDSDGDVDMTMTMTMGASLHLYSNPHDVQTHYNIPHHTSYHIPAPETPTEVQPTSSSENENESHSPHYPHEEDEDAYDDEEEFNPYLFIKCLPSYSQVVPYPKAKICLPPQDVNGPPISLVLDLDETLVHCTVEPIPDADMVFPVLFNGVQYQVHVRTRPFLMEFLSAVSKKFEVIVFTASQQVYANELLDRIDPHKKYIRHRLFRESCLLVQGNYIKDLNVLDRNLKQSVLVDNSPHAFGYQVDNGIPIESWFDDPNDTELLKLQQFLETLHGVDDVRTVVRSKFQTYKLIHHA